MKFLVVWASIMCLCAETFATTYYSLGSIANELASWNTSPTGGGSIPTSFTSPGDQFIISGGTTMTTTSHWSIGSATSTLRISSNGILIAVHSIFFDGTFQIDNGGIYRHNNSFTISSLPGASIFGGNESFAPLSTVEITNWEGNGVALPNIQWGNLVINYTNSLGGHWNQHGNLQSVAGTLSIRSTALGEEFQLTANTNLSATIGHLAVLNGSLTLKTLETPGTSCIVQVEGNVIVQGGAISLGKVDYLSTNELRLRGNYVGNGGQLISGNPFPYLVFNGSSIQNFTSDNTINANMKVASGAYLLLNTSLTLGPSRLLVIAGVCTSGGHTINLNNGQLFVAGGTMNASGTINLQNSGCTVCTGMGVMSPTRDWCLDVGTKGILNMNGSTMVLSRSLLSSFNVGRALSPGEAYLTNTSKISFTGAAGVPAYSSAQMEHSNSVLSFDASSVMEGEAFYDGRSGMLIVGSPDGINSVGNFGNIRVARNRNYNLGINSFCYNGTQPQNIGTGLPANSVIRGSLKINNTSAGGVSMLAPLIIDEGGKLELQQGILKTNSSFLLTLRRNVTCVGGSASSYIDGPIKKIGNENFTFHIGRAGLYSPVVMESISDQQPTDEFTAEYVSGNPKAVYGNSLAQYIDHISSVEYWVINGPWTHTKKLTFSISPYSNAPALSKLLVAYWDNNYWINYGNHGHTGSPSNGTISITTGYFGPFTFGSTVPSHIICPNGSTSFSITPAGIGFSYQWQVNTGNGTFSNITNNTIYSGTTTNALSLQNVPSSYYGYQYRCIATKGSEIITSEVSTIKFSSTWEGATNTSWSSASNWSCKLVPDQYTDVMITSGGLQPRISNSTSCRSVFMFSGASLQLAPGVSLGITGRSP